jgi:putative thiamine transport system substrate-binding protein
MLNRRDFIAFSAMEARLKKLLAAAAIVAGLVTSAWAADPDPANWDAVLGEARGETVYFNAWGGSENINAYIEWAGNQIRDRYGVKLVHVKLDDTANAVAKVVAEKAAGKNDAGTVDLIWINGENFASMKRQGLLLSAGWAQELPNWQYVDVENKPTILTDFTIPTEGQESPWGMAKLVFFHDSARTEASALPMSADELLEWAKANPGRFSYPQPPDFIGSSFLKQVLSEKVADRSVLLKPVDEATFDAITKPLFDYLDQLHPVMWRSGGAYPQNYPAMRQLLADGELDIIFAFNPAEASSAIANGELPDTVRSFTFPGGTLSNTHFVAIPYNAAAKAGALVLANFLISPEAQARKQDPQVWGDPTVLDVAGLPSDDQARFEALDLGIATLAPEDLGPALDEPHPTWMDRLEMEWKRRYGVAN